KREFLAAGLGTGLGLGGSFLLREAPDDVVAQAAPSSSGPQGVGRNVRRREVRTTAVFKAPSDHPNGLEVDPDGRGVWVAEQKLTEQTAAEYGLPVADD